MTVCLCAYVTVCLCDCVPIVRNRYNLHLRGFVTSCSPHSFPSSKSITRLKVSSCGRVLVSASLDGTVVLWDIRSKQTMKMHTLKSKRQRLHCMV